MVVGPKVAPSSRTGCGGAWWRATGIAEVHGAYQRAIGSLIGVVAAREIAASDGPAQRNGKAAALKVVLAHDVSIVLGVGRHLGSHPRAKTSITIMRAPRRGHGERSTRVASGVTSGFCFGLASGGSAPSSARAVAMLSARLALAKSP